MVDLQNGFFIIEYAPNDAGIPYFMNKKWLPELPDYNIHVKPPLQDNFSDKYRVKIKSYQLDGDYFPNDSLVSNEIFKLSNELNVGYVSTPVDILLYKNKSPEKPFHLFYLSDYLSILDLDNSEFSISKNIETGLLDTPEDRGLDKIYYEKIDRFHIRDNIEKDLFFLSENI